MMNVRYGLADILGYMNSVRFAPESRHSPRRLKTARSVPEADI